MAKISKTDREKTYATDGGKCLQCGSTNNLTIDHVIPLSRGGKNHISNYQTLCGSCNLKKGDKVRDLRAITPTVKKPVIKKQLIASHAKVIKVSHREFHNKWKLLHNRYMDGYKIMCATLNCEINTFDFHEK